jgi:hypothetical protein
LRDRSVLELMILAFTFVVGFAIIAVGATITVVEIRDPDVDTASATQALLTLVSGILGALLGLIAGRSGVGSELHRRPSGDNNGIE